MGVANAVINEFLERKPVFADLINGCVYGGRKVLCADNLEALPTRRGIVVQDENGHEKAEERYCDVRMKADLGTYSVIFGGEAQSYVDYAMPVRCMMYDSMEYSRQIRDLKKKHLEAGDKLKQEEYLSGITSEDRLIPVVTVVLYWGEKWDGKQTLSEMFGFDNAKEAEILKQYLPDYKINLINLNEIADPEVFDGCLKHICQLAKFRNDAREMKQYFDEHKSDFKKMDSVENKAISLFLGERDRVFKVIEQSEKEELKMCEAITEMINDGIAEGREEGRQIQCIELICKKLIKGKRPAAIADDLEMEEAEVQSICMIAAMFAPDYPADQVYAEWKKALANNAEAKTA